MNADYKNSKMRQSGYSVVELMVAVAIGLLVLAGVLGLFVTNKGVFTNTTQATELQEGGRFALAISCKTYVMPTSSARSTTKDSSFQRTPVRPRTTRSTQIRSATGWMRSTASMPTQVQRPSHCMAQRQQPAAQLDASSMPSSSKGSPQISWSSSRYNRKPSMIPLTSVTAASTLPRTAWTVSCGSSPAMSRCHLYLPPVAGPRDVLSALWPVLAVSLCGLLCSRRPHRR